MSTRPTPRKSSLTGSSPIAPPTPAPAEPAAATAQPAAEGEQPAPSPKATSKPAAKPADAAAAKKYPHKVSFYQDAADTARIRGAILHTQVTEGSRSLSQFIDQAVMEKVAALEAKYNDGKPFPAIGARELPQGRPMGE